MAVPDLEPRTLGRTGLLVTPVCVGGGPLGGLPGLYGYEVSAPRHSWRNAISVDGPINKDANGGDA